MARPRKNDPGTVILPIVEQFVRRLGGTLERFIMTRIAKETRDRGGAGRGGRRRRRAKVLCYYTGCKNVAAPRFGMFCAALHKGLSKSEKEKYRARRTSTAAPASRTAAKKRG